MSLERFSNDELVAELKRRNRGVGDAGADHLMRGKSLPEILDMCDAGLVTAAQARSYLGRSVTANSCPRCLEIGASGDEDTMIRHHHVDHGVPLPAGGMPRHLQVVE